MVRIENPAVRSFVRRSKSSRSEFTSLTEARTFHISPKTSHRQLASGEYLWTRSATRAIANDIIANAGELLGETADASMLDAVMNRIAEHKGIIYQGRGKDVLARETASTVGMIASYMEWDMHSPEVVYMSGQYFISEAKKEFDRLNRKIRRIKDGSRIFESNKAETAALEREQRQVDSYYHFAKKGTEALEQFARQTLPPDPTYLEVLSILIHLNTSKISPSLTRGILNLLKKGEITIVRSLLDSRKTYPRAA